MELSDLIENRKPTINMVGLTVLTLGVYPFLWLWSNRANFASFSEKPYTQWSIIIASALWSWGVTIGQTGDTFENVDNDLFIALSLISLAMQLVLLIYFFIVVTMPSLKGLSELLLKEEKIDLRINPVWAFLFAYFYMNYKINEISDLRKRKEILDR
jgi:hypothetical protein